MTADGSAATLIIGLAGRKRSGKDTAAARLVAEHSFVAIASAVPIKQILERVDPYLVGERMSGTFAQASEAFRIMRTMQSNLGSRLLGRDPSLEVCAEILDILDPVLTPERPGAPRLSELLHEVGGDWNRLKDETVPAHAEIRRLQQVLGTEAGRSVLGDDVWIEKALDRGSRYMRASGMAGLAITDIRFDNEAAKVRDADGIIIEIVRPELGENADTHASEAGLSAPADHVIVNDGTIEDLHEKIDGLVAELAGR